MSENLPPFVLSFDVDGTITGKEGFSLELIRLLRQVSKTIPVVINTSRSVEFGYAASKDWGLVGLNGDRPYVICENGGMIYGPVGQHQLLFGDNKELYQELARLNDRGISLLVAPDVKHLTDLTLFRSPNVPEANRILKQENKYTITDNVKSPIVCMHKLRSNKGSGLLRFMELKGWSQVPAYHFGDAANDLFTISQFAMAGKKLTFVAPASAEPQVLQAADYVCKGGASIGPLEYLTSVLKLSSLFIPERFR